MQIRTLTITVIEQAEKLEPGHTVELSATAIAYDPTSSARAPVHLDGIEAVRLALTVLASIAAGARMAEDAAKARAMIVAQPERAQ
jgi:hypothetical protein